MTPPASAERSTVDRSLYFRTAPTLADHAAHWRDMEEPTLLEELRHRRWARENYAAADARDPSWHPLVLDEMQRRDAELRQDAEAQGAVERPSRA